MATMSAPRTFVPVAQVGDIENGKMKSYRLGQRKILVARIEDKYYAANSICPHMGGNLSLGKLEGTVLTCPRHASKFDLADGQVIRWTDWTGVMKSVNNLFRSPRPLDIYPVKVENNNILVGI